MMMIQLCKLLFCLMVLERGFAWETLFSQNWFMPSSISNIFVPLGGASIEIDLTWVGSSDLDLYLYEPNPRNLLSQSESDCIARQISQSKPQILIEDISSAGSYFVRVDLASGQPTSFSYTYTSVDNNGDQTTTTVSNEVYSDEEGIEVVKFWKNQKLMMCKGKIQYEGTPAEIKLFQPGDSISDTPFLTYNSNGRAGQEQILPIPFVGEWTLAIKHGRTYLRSKLHVSLSISIEEEEFSFCQDYIQEQECSEYYKWDDESKECVLADNGFFSYAPIITSVFVCACVIIIASVICRTIQRRRAASVNTNQRMDARHQFFESSLMSIHEKPLSKMTSCAICLEESMTLAELECGHSYHEACIKAWVRKNNNCPLCRQLIVPNGPDRV